MVAEYGYDGLAEIEKCIASKDWAAVEESLEENPEKTLRHVYDNRKDAQKFYKVATLNPDICYGFRGSKLIWPVYYVRLPTRSKVINVLDEMYCAKYLEDLEYLFPTETLVTAENFDEVSRHFTEHLPMTPCVSFDYETVDTLKSEEFNAAMPKGKGNYVDVISSRITGCSLNYGPDLQYTIYIPTLHKETYSCDPSTIRGYLKEVERAEVPLIAHNNSFELLVSDLNLDYRPEKPYDTMIMASYVNENELKGLKPLSERVFRYQQTSYKEVLEAAGANDMSELTGEQVLSYGCDDSLITGRLFGLFKLTLKMEGMWDFYDQKERAPVHVLNHAFDTGVRIDYAKVDELHKEADVIIEEGMLRVREILGERCLEPSPDAAAHLDEMDGSNLTAILSYKASKKGDKAPTDDALLAKKQERLFHWEEAAVYEPYAETYFPPTFLGTHTQLNIVAEGLGLDMEVLKLPSNSKKQINIFLTNVRQLNYGEEAVVFAHLLGESAHMMKKREGPEFEGLAKFCVPYLGEGSLVKEGDELNFNSPLQMQELIYCKLGLPVRKRTKVQRDSSRSTLGLEGSPSCDEKGMKMAIAEDCHGENAWKADVLNTVIDVKEQKTLTSLYYNPYPLWKHPRDGVIHPQIRNCGTVTRRPTGGQPNLLQVKKGRTRTIVLPREDDHVIVAIDFSGQELRITGSEANDPVMIDAYTGGGVSTDEYGMVHPVCKDIHSVTAISFAETIFQRELSTSDFSFSGDHAYGAFRDLLFCDDPKLSAAANLCRKMAKVVNFLIIYGGQASTLAMGLGVPEKFAEELMKLVFRTYGRLAPWQDETITFAKQHGYVKTAYGNLKHLTEDIRSKDGSRRSRQERQAVNQTVQGCAADILKEVLTASYETNIWEETESVMIAPVYDEIVSSVPVSTVFEYCGRMQEIMNVTPPGHAIPMMAEVSIGPNWGSVVELGDNPAEVKIMECIESFEGEVSI